MASLSYRVAIALTPLEFQEESFDEIAFAIEREVGFAWCDTISPWRNDCDDSTLVRHLDQGVRIIGFVGEKGVGQNLFEQGAGLTEIRLLAWSE